MQICITLPSPQDRVNEAPCIQLLQICIFAEQGFCQKSLKQMQAPRITAGVEAPSRSNPVSLI